MSFVQFDLLSKYKNELIHAFTTRHGGVSKGECNSLNFGFNRNDSKQNILENFKIISKLLNIKYEDIVISNQIHDNKIKVVKSCDKGKGIIRESDIIGFDGLVTNEPGIPIVTFYADCIPIFMFDREKKVIATVHSGWRSTYKKICIQTVNIMKNEFNSLEKDIDVVIGPSIGKCCFEVDEDVYNMFKENYNQDDLYRKINGKWLIDLKQIVMNDLLKSGILKDNIEISSICTKCNKDTFFSYRGDNNKTGSMIGIMQLI